MRRLCFGGSFDPVHNGHLICCRAAAEAAGYDRVVLVPASQAPHKTAVRDVAPAADRLAMCRAAVAGDPLFEVSTVELDRTGPSYTIRTARQLRAAWGPPVHWLIGADLVASLPQWHDAAALAGEVEFVGVARPGWSIETPAGWSVRIVTAPLLQISSTDVRRRAAAGLSIRYLVPDAVAAHVAAHHLYGWPG